MAKVEKPELGTCRNMQNSGEFMAHVGDHAKRDSCVGWQALPPSQEGTRMRKFRKKPVVIAASQWFKNGDHPDDYANNVHGFEKGELHTWSGLEARELGWEGQVVRYFRRPDIDGLSLCRHCEQIMHIHGWIDTREGGHIVCPGDWIITGVKGERYPCKPDIFEATYEPAE